MSSTRTTSRPVRSSVDVLEDPHPAAVGREARDGDEVDRDVDAADRAGEVGEEDQRALEHADEHDAVGMVGRDLRAEALDDRREVRLAEQRSPVAGRRRGHSASRSSRAASRRNAVRRPRPSVGELDQLLLQRAPGPRGCAGAARPGSPARRAPPRARRSCGTCGGDAPRCRAAKNPAASGATASASSSNGHAVASARRRLTQPELLELGDAARRSRPAAARELGPGEVLAPSASGAPSRSSSRSSSAASSARQRRRARRPRRGAGAARRSPARGGLRSPSRSRLGAGAPRRVGSRPRRRRLAPTGSASGRTRGRAAELARRQLVEPLLDHLQRQEVLLLLVQDPAQPGDVGVVELPVARRRPLGVDEALALEEPDLRDRDVGELVAQRREHLADREVLRRRRGASLSRRSRPGRRARTGRSGSRRRSMQRRGVDPLVVHVGAVERADVARPRSRRRRASIDRVAARHGDVVEEDVGVGVAAERGRPRRRAR